MPQLPSSAPRLAHPSDPLGGSGSGGVPCRRCACQAPAAFRAAHRTAGPAPDRASFGAYRPVSPAAAVSGAAGGAAASPPRAADATTAATSTSTSTSTTPLLCSPSAYQSLSLLMLLQECTRRAYGRPLVESSDPAALASQLDSLACCVVLLAPDPPPILASAVSGQAPAPAGAAAASGAAQEPSARGAAAAPVGGGTGGGHAPGLCVRYLNRAAAQALQVAGSANSAGGSSSNIGSGGGKGGEGKGGGGGGAKKGAQPLASDSARSAHWPLLAGEEGAASWVREAMALRGEPRRGELRSLTLLRAGGSDGPQGPGHAGAGGAGACVAVCPQALVLALLSPSGVCAGVALLFDRWEVRQATDGAVGRHSGATAAPIRLEGRPLVPEVPPGSQPCSDAALAALQERVRAQADAVRDLKGRQGLPNQDPAVAAAVAELQRTKADLELQQRLQRAFSAGDAGVVQSLLQAPAQGHADVGAGAAGGDGGQA